MTEFLKPGIEEVCQVLPHALARRIIAYSDKRGWLDTVHVGMYVKTTSVTGYLRFWLLAKLRPLRRFMHRYVVEQAQIESWLAMILQAARLSPALALEVAECARLIKGYGSTHKRGTENFEIIETRLIRSGPAWPDPGSGRDRRHRQRPHGSPSRSRRQLARQVPGRVRRAHVIPHCCGIASIPGRHCKGRPLRYTFGAQPRGHIPPSS